MNRRYVAVLPKTDELKHYGIAGQVWGRRRFQYSNGTLTPEGRERYGYGPPRKKNRAKDAVESFGRSVVKTAKKATASVKEHYPAFKEGVSRASKKAGNAVSTSIKRRFPSLMTEKELIDYTKRAELETKYRDAVRNVNSRKAMRRAAMFTGDLLKAGTKKYVEQFANDLAKQTASRITKTRVNKMAEDMASQKSFMTDLSQYYDQAEKAEKNRLKYEDLINEQRAKEKADRDAARAERKNKSNNNSSSIWDELSRIEKEEQRAKAQQQQQQNQNNNNQQKNGGNNRARNVKKAAKKGKKH